MRKEVISFEEFMQCEKVSTNKSSKLIATTCATIIALTTFPNDTVILAADGLSSIDTKAGDIYLKLLVVGKWIIIIKGAMDTVNSTVQGDFQAAKKAFLSYLVVYLVLHSLPWAMNEIDEVFKSL